MHRDHMFSYAIKDREFPLPVFVRLEKIAYLRIIINYCHNSNYQLLLLYEKHVHLYVTGLVCLRYLFDDN